MLFEQGPSGVSERQLGVMCTLCAAALANPHFLVSAVLCMASGSNLPLCLGVGVGPDRAGADAIHVQPTKTF